jgi:hypothetical protein
LQYIGNKEALKRTYLLEQKYWTKFLSLPVDDSENFFIQKSTLDISANASPSENFSSRNLEEEEKISKVSSSKDFYSYPAACSMGRIRFKRRRPRRKNIKS